jgi:hypothetical protein
MKVKQGTNLEQYGFYQMDDEHDHCIILGGWYYKLGHSRRGQFYYYIVDLDMNLLIYGSDPDGSNGTIKFDDVIIKMFEDGVFE